MIPDHVVMLVCVLLVMWALFRWGTLILIGYALWYFWTEQWGFAGLCLVFAYALEAIKAGVMLISRCTGYRGPWI